MGSCNIKLKDHHAIDLVIYIQIIKYPLNSHNSSLWYSLLLLYLPSLTLILLAYCLSSFSANLILLRLVGMISFTSYSTSVLVGCLFYPMGINHTGSCRKLSHNSIHRILLYKATLIKPVETYILGFLYYALFTHTRAICRVIFHLLVTYHFCEAKIRNLQNVYITQQTYGFN